MKDEGMIQRFNEGAAKPFTTSNPVETVNATDTHHGPCPYFAGAGGFATGAPAGVVCM
jgi:hypothetical protein